MIRLSTTLTPAFCIIIRKSGCLRSFSRMGSARSQGRCGPRRRVAVQIDASDVSIALSRPMDVSITNRLPRNDYRGGIPHRALRPGHARSWRLPPPRARHLGNRWNASALQPGVRAWAMVKTVAISKMDLKPDELPQPRPGICVSNVHAREAVSSPIAAAAAAEERRSIDRKSATRRSPSTGHLRPAPLLPGNVSMTFDFERAVQRIGHEPSLAIGKAHELARPENGAASLDRLDQSDHRLSSRLPPLGKESRTWTCTWGFSVSVIVTCFSMSHNARCFRLGPMLLHIA